MNLLPQSRKRWLVALVCSIAAEGSASGAAAKRDEEVIAQLKEQIAQAEKAPAEAQSIFGFDADRAARRLGGLRQELAVLQKRKELEAQERNLRMPVNAQPR